MHILLVTEFIIPVLTGRIGITTSKNYQKLERKINTRQPMTRRNLFGPEVFIKKDSHSFCVRKRKGRAVDTTLVSVFLDVAAAPTTKLREDKPCPH